MNLRKRKILQRYKQGITDFQHANLRGLSFKGEDLSDADFSFADLRGTNFSGANLTGAQFCGAKAGLQKRWVVILLASIFVLVFISGLFNIFTSYVISLIFDFRSIDNQVGGWVSLIVILIFWITFIYKGIENSALAFAFAFAIVADIAMAFAGAFAGAGAFTFAIAGAIALVFAVTFAFAGAIAGAIAFAFAVTFAFAGAIAGALAGALLFDLSFDFAGAGVLPFAGALALVVTGLQTLLSAYVAYRTIKEDEEYTCIRNIAIAFAALCGTSFRDANLTDADFTNATLKNTDFRGANITRTCWKNTIKLDRIRPGKTYLKDAQVRELVRTGQGKNINLNRSDLQGINLQRTNLTNASFIEANLNSANLQDANLYRAKLVGTFLDQADFTGATLTGVFIEDWGITTTTKLDGIKCDYVYMRLPPKKRPDFLKLSPKDTLNDNPLREPANWKRKFKEGEFVDFITPMYRNSQL